MRGGFRFLFIWKRVFFRHPSAYSSILFYFKAFTSGSVVPLAMFRLRILKRKANVNNNDNVNVSEYDYDDEKAKKKSSLQESGSWTLGTLQSLTVAK